MKDQIKNLLGPIQFLIYCAILLISAGICYATVVSRIVAIEKELIPYKSDHELLVKISTQIEFMSKDIKELKADVKQHIMKEIK